MTRREGAGWIGALVMAMALLLVYGAPIWAFGYVIAVAVLFVVVELQPTGRLTMTRREVLDRGLVSSSVSVRYLVLLAGLGVAAVKGDGMFVVFGVLIVATLVLSTMVFQVFGVEVFGGTRKDR